jgi:hypothetical protein
LVFGEVVAVLLEVLGQVVGGATNAAQTLATEMVALEVSARRGLGTTSEVYSRHRTARAVEAEHGITLGAGGQKITAGLSRLPSPNEPANL